MSEMVATFLVEPVLSSDETKVSLKATAWIKKHAT